MSSLEEQTKESCKTMTESQKLPITQKPSTCHTSYSHIWYLMKRLNTALNKRLREGRPSKYCRVCKAELRSISCELMEKKNTSKAKPRRISKKPKQRSTKPKPSSASVYQCHKWHLEFARSDSLKRHLSSGVCKEDQKDMSEVMKKLWCLQRGLMGQETISLENMILIN